MSSWEVTRRAAISSWNNEEGRDEFLEGKEEGRDEFLEDNEGARDEFLEGNGGRRDEFLEGIQDGLKETNSRVLVVLSCSHLPFPLTSVADPGCLSRIRIFSIPDPDFLPVPDPGYRNSDLGSRIPDPGSRNLNNREGRKKIGCHTFFSSHKSHKI